MNYIKAYIIYVRKRGPWRLNPKPFFLWTKGWWKPAERQALRYGWYEDNSGWWLEAWANVPKQWTQIASTLHKNMLTRSMLNWFYISLYKLYLAIASQKGFVLKQSNMYIELLIILCIVKIKRFPIKGGRILKPPEIHTISKNNK